MTFRPQLASRFTKGGIIPAFTLAEVLVTLGVIGVVAAMTLPMLAKNYQFYIRQQQFKKAYAALNIAVQKTQIDMGEGVRCFYLRERNSSSSSREYIDCDYFFNEFVKNLQVIKQCENSGVEGKCLSQNMRGGEEVYAETQGANNPSGAKDFFIANCGGFSSNNIKKLAPIYVVNTGFTIIPYYSQNIDFTPIFAIDINALQGPNKWGHDIFVFWFYKYNKYDSVFQVSHTGGCHPLDEGGIYTRHFFEYMYGQNAEMSGNVHEKL